MQERETAAGGQLNRTRDSLPIKVNSFADQGVIRHVDTLKFSCGQTDSACGQIVFPMWPVVRVGVNTLFS